MEAVLGERGGLVRQQRAILGAAFAGALLLAGCAADGSASVSPPAQGTATPTPATGPVTPSASSPDGQAQAKAAVLAAYATFMDARNKSLNDPRKPPDRRLFQVSIPPARDEFYNGLLYYRRKGIEVRGAALSNPESPTLSSDLGVARFRDCVDDSDASPVLRRTGESVAAPGQAARVWVEVTAVNPDSGWVIQRWVVKRVSPC